MPHAQLSWQQAAYLAAFLLAAGLAAQFARGRLLRTAAPFAREAGLVVGLYALWQLAGTLAVVHTEGAYTRARWIVSFERDLRLPSERSAQEVILGHPRLVQAANIYYATMHFAALIALLFWLFARHRDRYAAVRTTIVLLTGACLLIQLLPVAPPRLLPGYGFVDTAVQYGQSVYAIGVGTDQLSAMPSVHVGWAVLVGAVVVTVSTSPWRWLVLLHPALTIFVVAATANHFWLDGIVAVLLLVLAVLLQTGTRRVTARLIARRVVGTLAPEPVGSTVE